MPNRDPRAVSTVETVNRVEKNEAGETIRTERIRETIRHDSRNIDEVGERSAEEVDFLAARAENLQRQARYDKIVEQMQQEIAELRSRLEEQDRVWKRRLLKWGGGSLAAVESPEIIELLTGFVQLLQ
jgi:hypothetical protein